jgi:uncharacterized protein YaaQ
MDDNQNPILLLAIVQSEDKDDAMTDLEKLGVFSAHLPSIGGFLGRKNASLFIATPHQRLPEVLDTLRRVCKQRTEYLSTHIESGTVPMSLPIPITVGGATVFFMALDHFEEF